MRKNNSGLNGWIVITRVALKIVPQSSVNSPVIQKIGLKLKIISFELNGCDVSALSIAAWLRHIPFERPVVPDEHTIAAV